MHSLRARLWILWLLAAGASAGVALLLLQLYQTTASARIERGEAVVARECQRIVNSYAFYVVGWNGAGANPNDPAFRRDLKGVVLDALAGRAGVTGGIWSAQEPLAQLRPISAGERNMLRSLNEDAATDQQSVSLRSPAGSATTLAASCPLPGPISGLTAWTLTRIEPAKGFAWLRTGLGLLLVLVLGIAAWATWLGAVWGRHVRRIEAVLTAHDIEELPVLPRTGERELDRIVAALNEAGIRLSRSRSRADAMSARAARSERMAALGRVAAGIAHEIRNPVAAMRLRLENALAGDPARHRPALEAGLRQIARVDRLVSELLAMTQRRDPEPEEIDLRHFLQSRARDHCAGAEHCAVRLDVVSAVASARFDPEMIGRALDNLVQNALRHTPRGGTVRLRAEDEDGMLRLIVEDTGPGVDPALRPRLFEPFATGRPDGTGLGLAIAREMVEAHGGRLMLAEAGEGARFVLELPWAPECPRS